MDKTVTGVYTDLDTLFDLRYTCYAQADFDLAAKALIDGFEGIAYYNRVTSVCSYIPEDDFLRYYNSRSKDELFASVPTAVFEFISGLAIQMESENSSDSTGEECAIFLNTYPYVLSPDEEGKLVSDLLGTVYLPETTVVETIHVDPMQLSQSYINKNNIKSIISFHGEDILGNLVTNFSLANNRLISVGLMIPAIANGNATNARAIFKKDEYGLGPFALLEQVYAELIEVKFLDAALFSGIMFKPHIKEEAEAPPQT